MHSFPIPRTGLNRIAGIEAFESQGRQFILYALLSMHWTFQVSLDSQALGLGQGAKLSFQFGVDADAHKYCPRVLSTILTRDFAIVMAEALARF
jgi:hypothetical protein